MGAPKAMLGTERFQKLQRGEAAPGRRLVMGQVDLGNMMAVQRENLLRIVHTGDWVLLGSGQSIKE